MATYNSFSDYAIEILENLEDTDVIEIWNRYCELNLYAEQVYPMGELDDFLTGSATEILESVADNFNTNHDYFYFSDSGYYTSFDYISDYESPIDLEIIAKNSSELMTEYDNTFEEWARMTIDEIIEGDKRDHIEDYFSEWFGVSDFGENADENDLEDDFDEYLSSIGEADEEEDEE